MSKFIKVTAEKIIDVDSVDQRIVESGIGAKWLTDLLEKAGLRRSIEQIGKDIAKPSMTKYPVAGEGRKLLDEVVLDPNNKYTRLQTMIRNMFKRNEEPNAAEISEDLLQRQKELPQGTEGLFQPINKATQWAGNTFNGFNPVRRFKNIEGELLYPEGGGKPINLKQWKENPEGFEINYADPKNRSTLESLNKYNNDLYKATYTGRGLNWGLKAGGAVGAYNLYHNLTTPADGIPDPGSDIFSPNVPGNNPGVPLDYRNTKPMQLGPNGRPEGSTPYTEDFEPFHNPAKMRSMQRQMPVATTSKFKKVYAEEADGGMDTTTPSPKPVSGEMSDDIISKLSRIAQQSQLPEPEKIEKIVNYALHLPTTQEAETCLNKYLFDPYGESIASAIKIITSAGLGSKTGEQ